MFINGLFYANIFCSIVLTSSYICEHTFVFIFQTHAEFEMTSGSMGIVSLERKCGLKHSMCNNACAEKSTSCWLCCSNYNSCNGFPLRANIVLMTSSVSRQLHCIHILPLIAIMVVLFVKHM